MKYEYDILVNVEHPSPVHRVREYVAGFRSLNLAEKYFSEVTKDIAHMYRDARDQGEIFGEVTYTLERSDGIALRQFKIEANTKKRAEKTADLFA